MNSAKQLIEQFSQELSKISSLKDLEQLRLVYIGKNGLVKSLFNSIKSIPDNERKEYLESINECKKFVEDSLEQTFKRINNQDVERRIAQEWSDLSLPSTTQSAGALHPLTLIQRKCMQVLFLLGFKYVDGPEIETPYHNFDALNIPEHHPARDAQDTFWLNDKLLLRSHTSTVQIRVLENEKQFPIKVISSGRVYRNETVDATHLACFHQFEGLWVDKGIKFSHLKGTIKFLLDYIFGEQWEYRFKPKYYPYTEPSLGVDIRLKGSNSEWLTILGAGMIHPNVLISTGHDPKTVSGFAFGLGISRMVTMANGINNMKSLYEGDLRVHQAISKKIMLED